MKAKQLMVMAVVVAASALVIGGESYAQGRGAGTSGGRGISQSTTQVRPEGSQRRDGSFLNTGITASGSTTRPTNGQGVMDGTGINHPASVIPTSTTP